MRTNNRRTTIPIKGAVAGFDLSLTATGIVILDYSGKVLLRKVIKSKEKGAKRLDDIQRVLRSSIGSISISLVCIEGYATGSTNGKTFHIGELGGVVRLLLYRLGIDYIDPKPTQLKKFATGKGGGEGGSKDQVTMFTYKNWGFQAIDNNEADAYVLARIALALKKQLLGDLNKTQSEVIHQILNPPEKKAKKKKED